MVVVFQRNSLKNQTKFASSLALTGCVRGFTCWSISKRPANNLTELAGMKAKNEQFLHTLSTRIKTYKY